MTARFDELRQARAMLIRLLDDGKPLPPVQGVDDLSPDDVQRLLVTCGTEVILHTVASIAGLIPPRRDRSGWVCRRTRCGGWKTCAASRRPRRLHTKWPRTKWRHGRRGRRAGRQKQTTYARPDHGAIEKHCRGRYRTASRHVAS